MWKILQVLHTGGDHWVLASNINCGIGQVNLYDSLYTVVSSETEILVEKFLGMLPSCYHHLLGKVKAMIAD